MHFANGHNLSYNRFFYYIRSFMTYCKDDLINFQSISKIIYLYLCLTSISSKVGGFLDSKRAYTTLSVFQIDIEMKIFIPIDAFFFF